MAVYLGVDIGTNSVGSAWIDTDTGQITTGTSIFPAGVDESDEKRGDPKNAKRRMTRRTRITLARRASRKRALRMTLISAGLLPNAEEDFKHLLETTDPWELRRKGLDEPLAPFEFGRVLLHLAQRRGALGLKVSEADRDDDTAAIEDGKVRSAISAMRTKINEHAARSFGEYIAIVRAERVTAIVSTDSRPSHRRKGERVYRSAIRNRAGSYDHCADRQMIFDEFTELWKRQKEMGGETARLLTDALRVTLDNPVPDVKWRHQGVLFGQRRQSWDLGTLGRCVLEPTERCVPHADMYASHYLVIETVNNLKIIERGREARALSSDERKRLITYLSGPLGVNKVGKNKGDLKRTVSVTDLREQLGWRRSAGSASQYRLNIENDPDKVINTDWFSREIIHGAITLAKWEEMPQSVRDGVNRAILKFDPGQIGNDQKLKSGVMSWGGLSESQADALIIAWQRRPNPDGKRLSMSRRAVRNLLPYMENAFARVDGSDGLMPTGWLDKCQFDPLRHRWLTQIEARKAAVQDCSFRDATTGEPLAPHARNRYATGAKGATARDRYYSRKHLLLKNGEPIYGLDGNPLHEPPPAPLFNNPVVRKAIHEVRRHLVEYMTTFSRKPDFVCIELAREAKMGKQNADRLLFKNRLRNRIRKDIAETFNLHSVSVSQQRAAVDRVVLAMQQSCICPLCGKTLGDSARDGITLRKAAIGEGCEVAHIIPRASGGHNGLANIVLTHTKCNRDMARRTPRQFWDSTLLGGFEKGIAWIEKIFGEVERPKPAEVRNATGNSLWACYFTKRDDAAKIEQFKKDVKDIQEMTMGQDAATKYAARAVMAYISDAIFDGKGLPERGGRRLVFATDGLWTSRFRREWGLFFDPHSRRTKTLSSEQEQERSEKDRGDHRHHAIDAVVIALSERHRQLEWEDRDRKADREGVNTADEAALGAYRRNHPIDPPPPFKSRELFREQVRQAVFGDSDVERPICHRPVKRKLIGALHEETLFGPVVDASGNLTNYYTARKSVLELDPNHLRMPRPETMKEAIERLAARKELARGADARNAVRWARSIVASKAYHPAIVDPPPGKSGIVRDVSLRAQLRRCLEGAGVDPDDFSKNHVKQLVESNALRHESGVPIRSVVLLRTMADPIVVRRYRNDYATGNRRPDSDPASSRAYVSGNNHHVEIRVLTDKNGQEKWTGRVITAYEAATRKTAKLRALKQLDVPRSDVFRALGKSERKLLRPIIRSVELAHPIVDRRDDDANGGRFVMSLCEGDTLLMRRKADKRGESPGPVSYFVVAKLERKEGSVGIVLVPHWDARTAGERTDADGNKVPNSKREQFTATPTDLKVLAPPGERHAVKVRVSPLGRITRLERD
ncbi:MAG: HNH endonuclease domain-containing protein [Pirellulales bacterium]